MATPRRKPTKASAVKKPAPKKKLVVKPTPPKSVPGSKQGFTAMLREQQNKENPKAVKTADPNSFVSIVKALKASYVGKKVNILDVPFMERDIARVLGAEYVERIRQYVYAGDIIPAQLQQYKSKDYSYNRWLEDQINGSLKPAQKTLGEAFTPRKHQQEGVDAIREAATAGWRGFVLADLTGLGKTLTALLGTSQAAAVRGFTKQNKAKTLIICPNNAVIHWQDSIRRSKFDNLRILVINYEQYKKLLTVPKAASDAKKQSTKNKHIASSGKPFIHWDMIIADESHKLKNYDSQRTQGFQTIAEYSNTTAKAPFIIWCSATIGQQPLELGYLAPLIGQVAKKPLTMETWPAWLYDNKFHVRKAGKSWAWVKPSSPTDAIPREQQREDVQRLANIIFHPKAPSIRRKPEDIAGWPPVNRIAQPVQLGSSSEQEYKKIWLEFRKDMQLKVKGKNPKGALATQLRFAQKASLLRVNQTVDNIVEQLENGYQVAVSVRFIETLDAIKSSLTKLGLGVSEYSGRDFINKERERLEFQRGDNKVILFTVEEAVSFHAKEQLADGTTASPFPRALFVHDLRYSALSITQIIGRTHRDGQASNAYFLYAEGTMEEIILNIMLNKLENMTALSGDEEEELFSIMEEVLQKQAA